MLDVGIVSGVSIALTVGSVCGARISPDALNVQLVLCVWRAIAVLNARSVRIVSIVGALTIEKEEKKKKETT